MIISHKYKFIFIKTLKTAGTSIEVDLSKILGENDVATKIRPRVEGHIAQNYGFRKHGLFKHEWINHTPASIIRKHLGARIFDNYFKFCVEREPVDKCISHYSMYQNSPKHKSRELSNLTWEEYLEIGNFPVDTE
ncbi:MAG: sulfotransferase family 2 domain-containing protein, partial [Pseudomonadota bacterium]